VRTNLDTTQSVIIYTFIHPQVEGAIPAFTRQP